MDAYVINLDRRPDRRAHIRGEMERHGIDYEFIRAVDDRDLVYAVYPPMPNRPSVGSIGCILSHRKIWREIVDLGLDNALVFEDDAILCDDFDSRFQRARREVPADFDILFLGCGYRGEVMISESVARVADVWTTHAYVVSLQGAKNLLRYVLPVRYPVDSQISECDAIKKYVVLPILAWQPWFRGPLTEPWMEKCS